MENLKSISSYRKSVLLLGLIISGLYFFFQSESIYGGDAGDLASAIIVHGIPHPPGYPLYTLLGIVLTKILPIGTYAWRIGFLSSLPAIFTIVILYDLIFYLTKKTLIAVISSLIMAFVYPFWLYSEVVEVFSLNNLFLVGLYWLFIHWAFEGKPKYLYFASFFFGLSLTHHHIILFLTPCLIYLLSVKKKKLSSKLFFRSFLLFLFGLAPYAYVLVTSFYNNSPVNWMGPLTLGNFGSLVTRAGYGTFRAGGYISHDPFLRLLDVWAFIDFIYRDFRLPGLVLGLLGIYYLAKYRKPVFISLLLGFSSYLFFLFYASFPLVDNFMVATYERFLLPLYILVIPVIAYGLVALELLFTKFIGYLFISKTKLQIVIQLALASFLIYPLGLFMVDYPKISILKSDFTAENLGKDILSSIPPNSMLIITTDTPLFDTQYVYYALNRWPDVKLIHLTKLTTPYYLQQLKRFYPDLELPETNNSSQKVFTSFINDNYKKFPIYSKLVVETNEGTWVPYGLLFRYLKNEDKKVDDESILAENERLWSSYHDPLLGSLSKYHNLMLSDILSIYATAHQEIGYWAAKKGYSLEAEKHLWEAEKLNPGDLDSYIILTQVYILEGRCKEAEDQIGFVTKKNRDDERIYYLQAINYAVCIKDQEKSSYYQKLYEEKKRGKETHLKKL